MTEPKYNYQFVQQFEIDEKSHIVVDTEYELDKNEPEYLLSTLTFSNKLFSYTMSDISYESFIPEFLDSYYQGGNSFTEIDLSSDGTYLSFSSTVSGSGGNALFHMKLPYDVAVKVHQMLIDCKAECDSKLL